MKHTHIQHIFSTCLKGAACAFAAALVCAQVSVAQELTYYGPADAAPAAPAAGGEPIDWNSMDGNADTLAENDQTEGATGAGEGIAVIDPEAEALSEETDTIEAAAAQKDEEAVEHASELNETAEETLAALLGEGEIEEDAPTGTPEPHAASDTFDLDAAAAQAGLYGPQTLEDGTVVNADGSLSSAPVADDGFRFYDDAGVAENRTPKFEIPTEANYGVTMQTRDQLSNRSSTIGNRKIALDYNWGYGQSYPLVIIPNNATPAERAAANAYVQETANWFRANGVDVGAPQVKTTAQNGGRGVGGFFHTEPAFVQDKAAMTLLRDKGHEYSAILAGTLGQVNGATFIAPHKTSDPGAGGAKYGFLGERDFARQHIIPNLVALKDDPSKIMFADLNPYMDAGDFDPTQYTGSPNNMIANNVSRSVNNLFGGGSNQNQQGGLFGGGGSQGQGGGGLASAGGNQGIGSANPLLAENQAQLNMEQLSAEQRLAQLELQNQEAGMELAQLQRNATRLQVQEKIRTDISQQGANFDISAVPESQRGFAENEMELFELQREDAV